MSSNFSRRLCTFIFYHLSIRTHTIAKKAHSYIYYMHEHERTTIKPTQQEICDVFYFEKDKKRRARKEKKGWERKGKCFAMMLSLDNVGPINYEL